MDNGTSSETSGENSNTYDELAEIIKFLKTYKEPPAKKRKVDDSIKPATKKIANTTKKNTLGGNNSKKLKPVIHLLKSNQKSKPNLRKKPFNSGVKRGASIALLSDDEISEPDSPTKPTRILRSQANNLEDSPDTKRVLRSSKKVDNYDEKDDEELSENNNDIDDTEMETNDTSKESEDFAPVIEQKVTPEKITTTIDQNVILEKLAPTIQPNVTPETEIEKPLVISEPEVETNDLNIDDGDDLERLMIYLDEPVKKESPQPLIDQPDVLGVKTEEIELNMIEPKEELDNFEILTDNETSNDIKPDASILKQEIQASPLQNTPVPDAKLELPKKEVLDDLNTIVKNDYDLLDEIAHSNSTDLNNLIIQQASQEPNLEVKPIETSLEPFQCTSCSSSYKTFSKFSMHMRKEHEIVVFEYKCDQCEFQTNTKSKFLAHKRSHSALSLECEECKMKFASKVALSKHAKVHFTGKFTCDICNKVFPKEHSLKVHKVRMHKEKKLIPNASSTIDNIIQEVATIVSDSETDEIKKPSLKLKKCNICNIWISGLADHSHPEFDLLSTGLDKLPEIGMLPEIDEDLLRDNPDNNLEVKSDSPTSDITSSEKSNESTTSSSLNNSTPSSPLSNSNLPNSTTPSTEKNNIYRCPYCEKTFVTSSGFKKHLTIHSKPDGSAATQVKPKLHKCNVDTCNASFTTLTQLKKHAKGHQKNTFIMCPFCDKQCKDVTELLSHQIQTHSDLLKKHAKSDKKKENILCVLCNQEYTNVTELVTHQIQIHAGD